MRYTLFVLAVTLGGLTTGCKDSAITEPAGAIQLTPDPIHKAVTQANVAAFKGPVDLPASAILDQITRVFVHGRSIYTITRIPGLRPEFHAFEIATDAEITVPYPDGPSWKATGKSIDRIKMNRYTRYSIEKKFLINGMTPERYLHLRFAVTPTQVSVVRMWITGDERPSTSEAALQ
jgi:hypothetical protein